MFDERPQTERHTFQFNGKAGEFFGIWIVNLVLTILTLGIYSAWAKVRTNRYFYGNTSVAGSTFDYTADPSRILLGRAIAVTMLVLYQLCVYLYPAVAVYVLILFLLIVPFIYLASIAFRMRYTQWRNINFGFDRDLRGAYLLFLPVLLYVAFIFVGPALFGIEPADFSAGESDSVEASPELNNYLTVNAVVVFSAMLLFPFWQKHYYSFIGNRVSFGKSDFSMNLRTSSFYIMYLMIAGFFLLLSIGMVFTVAMLLPPDASDLDNAQDVSQLSAVTSVFLYGIPLAYLTTFAFLKTRLTNLLYSNIGLEGVDFESTLKLGRMLWLYLTNTIAIVCTLGLAYPWAKIRLARYRAENMHMLTSGDINVVADESRDVNASGEAITELFDFEIGL